MDEKVIADLSELPQIPEASVQAYKEHLAALVEKVNGLMSSRPDLRLLIGENPLSMMFANHKNHALFMSNVFALHQYELLEAVQNVIQSITSWPAEKRPKIMVGGLAFAGFPQLPEQLGADGYARDCSQAVQLARTWK
ncbi:MAG: hypothetical protein KGY41_10925, partial [Desulfovermiculus sp.]|nr:hypothetical protein [Desulfovermiculus sp.]